MDIAIDRGHREVIRVLLSDPNWAKLIRLSNRPPSKPAEVDEEDNQSGELKSVVVDKGGQDAAKKDRNVDLPIQECPEFNNMFDNKMWDVFKIILDKCVTEKAVDFSLIDPPVKSMSNHPLMLIARSGQENLLKHETTRMLLHLKWRIIPRCAFYFNLIVYIIFLLLFSIYSLDLSTMGSKIVEDYNSTHALIAASGNGSTKFELFKGTSYKLSTFNIMLIVMVNLQLLKELLQIFFLDGLSYFLSSQNLIEIFTYTISLMSLLSHNYHLQSAYGAIAVLSAFILFPLFIQKLKVFGLYVVAFRRTLT